MVLILLAALCADRNADLLEKKSYAALAGNPEETAAFRSMAVPAGVFESISSTCRASEESWASVLAAYMLDHQFAPDTSKDARPPEDGNYWSERVRGYERKNPEAFERLAQSYEAVYADLAVFPVPVSDMHPDAEVSYENSWMFERTFGGVRGHEGTDLMPSVKKEHFYPILSVTDGTVEQVGWLTKGGYRIGIRSPHGGYFYYAHLSAYAEEFEPGDTVRAGQLLGYMGNTGYGSEGTKDMFEVHLHFGIYIRTEHNGELSVNPYYILKYLEDFRIRYNF